MTKYKRLLPEIEGRLAASCVADDHAECCIQVMRLLRKADRALDDAMQ